MWSLYTVVFLSALLPATCANDCELTLNITRNLSGPALNGPVVIRANNASSIWCSVICISRRGLSDFSWRYSNGTRVPVVDRGESSDLGVYAERYASIIGNSTETTWRRILHFKRAQPSSAGNYTCVADYRQETTYKSVEVQVTGVKGTSSTSSGTSPTSSGTSPTSSGTSPTSSGTSPTSSGAFPTSSGSSPTSSGISPTSSGTSPRNSSTTPTSSSIAGPSGVTLGTVPLAVIASVGIIVLLLLGCVTFIILAVVVYRKYQTRKTFRPEELYDTSDMECVPVGTKKEVMVLADLTTNVLSWPGDAIGQPLNDDKESEFEDNHSITEAYAEVSVVAVADSTGLHEPKHTDVTQDRAQPGNGGEELPVGLAFDVPDYSLVQKRETKTSPEAVHLRAKAFQANQFVEHVKRMHEEKDKGFEEEFKKVADDPNGVHNIATANRSKNRYRNIHTLDHSRVVLSVPDGWGSDYINASYINGEHGDIYIASQGPTPETISDFWQMIWDVKPAVIVMLTKVDENGKRKCEQYWNDQLDKPYDAGSFTVVTTRCRGFADYVVRDLTLRSPSHGSLFVKQFQYSGWPDYGVPLQPSSLLKFSRKVRMEFEGTGAPTVVHCSAGVGRTGIFITLDAMMERLKERDDLNIFEFVNEMRTRRKKMVQTLDQYMFIHDALCDHITCGDTSVLAHELKATIATLGIVDRDTKRTQFQEQFTVLEKVCKSPCSEDIAFAKMKVVAYRNRYKDKFPYSSNCLRIPYSSASNGTDYINATFVNSYSSKCAFIAAQSPMTETRNDIWELIWQFRTSTIVLLCDSNEDDQESCFPFWPDKRMGTLQLDCKLVKVSYNDTVPMKEYDKIFLDVFNSSKLSSPPLEVVLYHIKGWPTAGPPPVASLLNVMGEVGAIQKKEARPVLVMCDDGMSRSGVFITCMSEIERVKDEGAVDIFQSVKAARAQRPHMVNTSEQYKMCFEILQFYLESFDTYANYKTV